MLPDMEITPLRYARYEQPVNKIPQMQELDANLFLYLRSIAGCNPQQGRDKKRQLFASGDSSDERNLGCGPVRLDRAGHGPGDLRRWNWSHRDDRQREHSHPLGLRTASAGGRLWSSTESRGRQDRWAGSQCSLGDRATGDVLVEAGQDRAAADQKQAEADLGSLRYLAQVLDDLSDGKLGRAALRRAIFFPSRDRALIDAKARTERGLRFLHLGARCSDVLG